MENLISTEIAEKLVNAVANETRDSFSSEATIRRESAFAVEAALRVLVVYGGRFLDEDSRDSLNLIATVVANGEWS